MQVAGNPLHEPDLVALLEQKKAQPEETPNNESRGEPKAKAKGKAKSKSSSSGSKPAGGGGGGGGKPGGQDDLMDRLRALDDAAGGEPDDDVD